LLERDSWRFQAIARLIDNFITLDLTGVGLISRLFEARNRHQPEPMCVNAAQLILSAFKEKKQPVLIATGFPEGGGIPETDGPVGAAMLARALFLGLGVHSVIVTDEDWEECLKGACRGGGLVPMPFPESGVISEIEYLRPVFIKTVPKNWDRCHPIADELLDVTQPGLLVSIERPGMNKHGVYHGMGGRVLNDLVGDLDYLFRKGRTQGLPSLAFGDGGNELGMGVISEDLPSFLPKAVECGCPCGGGIGGDLGADVLVVSSVSNWGVTGVIAALALLLGRADLMHDPELEVRSIDLCTAFGGIDGLLMAPELGVDGIFVQEWAGLIGALKGTLTRNLGRAEDWRQLK
jgi:hypothetical protein